jgi:hypothetical protein
MEATPTLEFFHSAIFWSWFPFDRSIARAAEIRKFAVQENITEFKICSAVPYSTEFPIPVVKISKVKDGRIGANTAGLNVQIRSDIAVMKRPWTWALLRISGFLKYDSSPIVLLRPFFYTLFYLFQFFMRQSAIACLRVVSSPIGYIWLKNDLFKITHKKKIKMPFYILF